MGAENRTYLIEPANLSCTTFNPDELDIGILRELHNPGSRWNFKESYPTIAKRLQVDVETVRRRVSKMESSGAIEGWAIMPNPHLLGREGVALYFEAPDDLKNGTMIENLGSADGVSSVHTFHGGSFLVFLECPNEAPLDGQIARIEALFGIQSSMTWTMHFPPFEHAMTPTDWFILRALRREPRRSLNEIAQELGISLRTLNRRMELLVEGDAFYLETIVNFQKIGRLSFTLLVHCSNGEKRSLDDLIWRKLGSLCEGRDTISSRSHSVFSLFADNLSEAKQTFEWVRNLDGVLDARMGIHEGRSLMTSWIDSEIETRSQALGPNMPRPRFRPSRPARPYVISKRSQKDTKGRDSWWSGSFIEGRRVKVVLDSDICMGSGSCVEIAPRVFQLDRERKKSIFDPVPLRLLKDRAANLEDVLLAAQSCPYRVIKLQDADTEEQLFP